MRIKITELSYASVFLSGGIFVSQNSAWIVGKGFSINETVIINISILFASFLLPPLLHKHILGRRLNFVISLFCCVCIFFYVAQEYFTDKFLVGLIIVLAASAWCPIVPLNEYGASRDTGGNGSLYAKYRITSAGATLLGGMILSVYTVFGVEQNYVFSLITCYTVCSIFNFLRPSYYVWDKENPNNSSTISYRDNGTIRLILPWGLLLGLNYILYLHYSVKLNEVHKLLDYDLSPLVWNIGFGAEVISFLYLYRYLDYFPSSNRYLLSALLTTATFVFAYISVSVSGILSILFSIAALICFGIAYATIVTFSFVTISNITNGNSSSFGFTVLYAISNGGIPLLIYVTTDITPEEHYELLILLGAMLSLFSIFFVRNQSA